MVLLQLAVVLVAIVMGVRTGGVGLGLWGLLGLAVLIFGFGSNPGAAPIDVVFIILTAVTAASVMEAAGGVQWMVSMAARLIRKNPKAIVFLAPGVAFLFTVGAGTGNVFFPLLPVIYDVSYEERIRPERPIAMATVFSQTAIMCSPVSAASAAMVVLLEPHGVSLARLLLVMWPATIIALIGAGLVMLRWGRELDKDPVYLERKERGLVTPLEAKDTASLPPAAFRSAMIFIAGVLLIVVLGLFDDLRPMVGPEGAETRLSIAATIQIVMGSAGVMIFLLCKPRASEVPRQSTFAAGMAAAIALFGLAWLASAFIAENSDLIMAGLRAQVADHPWMFGLALGIVAVLTTSQAAATTAMIPIGLSVGLSPEAIVAMWAAIGAVLILPTQGAQIAAVNIDLTGTTRIGAWVLNHSFQIPTLIYIAVCIAVAFPIAYLII